MSDHVFPEFKLEEKKVSTISTYKKHYFHAYSPDNEVDIKWQLRDEFSVSEVAFFYIGLMPIADNFISQFFKIFDEVDNHNYIEGEKRTKIPEEELYALVEEGSIILENQLKDKFNIIFDTLTIDFTIDKFPNELTTEPDTLEITQTRTVLVGPIISREYLEEWFNKKGLLCPKILLPRKSKVHKLVEEIESLKQENEEIKEKIKLSPEINSKLYIQLLEILPSFPIKYPDYKQKKPQVGLMKNWLQKEYRVTERTADTFAQIISEHYEL